MKTYPVLFFLVAACMFCVYCGSDGSKDSSGNTPQTFQSSSSSTEFSEALLTRGEKFVGLKCNSSAVQRIGGRASCPGFFKAGISATAHLQRLNASSQQCTISNVIMDDYKTRVIDFYEDWINTRTGNDCNGFLGQIGMMPGATPPDGCARGDSGPFRFRAIVPEYRAVVQFQDTPSTVYDLGGFIYTKPEDLGSGATKGRYNLSAAHLIVNKSCQSFDGIKIYILVRKKHYTWLGGNTDVAGHAVQDVLDVSE